MEVLQRTANRGSISTASYDIDNSLKLESDNSEYLKAEGRPAGNQQVWTWSCWLKRTEVNNGVVAQYMFSAGSDGKLGLYFRDDSSSTGGDTIFIYVDEGNSLKWIGELRVSFRDTSAWYHIVFAVDSTDGTAADRTKIYVNGVQQTITFNATLNQNSNTRIGDSGGKLSIGAKMDGSYEFNGYMAEVVLVDGSQLTPTSFGEFDDDSGIWKPKDVSSLSLGNAGFYMNFDDSSNLGKVQTGTNQGNFDLNNITAADQATDTPTNNFANLEVGRNPAATFITFNEGNTKLTYAGSTTGYDSDGSGISNFRVNTSGKWYMEFSFAGDGDRAVVGVVSDQGANHAADIDYTRYILYRANDGHVIYNTNGTDVNVSAAGPTYDSPDIIGIALDCDNERVSFSKNGSWIDGSGAGASNSSPTYFVDWTGHDFLTNSTGNGNCVFVCTNYVNSGTPVIESNFGGYTTNAISSAASDANGYGTFEYAPPSGYYALCTKNLAEYG